jgi:hypothetical protein
LPKRDRRVVATDSEATGSTAGPVVSLEERMLGDQSGGALHVGIA